MSQTSWINDHSKEVQTQFHSLKHTCGLLELSHRGRLCVTGGDRMSFLHGQVTQDIQSLKPGEGAFSTLADDKGKILADLNIYCLDEELLLDFEPGLTGMVKQRLERYLVSEDVMIVDPSEFYALLSLQGPMSAAVLQDMFPNLMRFAEKRWGFVTDTDEEGDDPVYICNRPRFGTKGFDLFIPGKDVEECGLGLTSMVLAHQGDKVTAIAAELASIESGVPKMGADMTPDILVQETGLESEAISFRKGCYIGQEIISRIRTVGKVNKSLRRLAFSDIPQLEDDMKLMLMADGKNAGWVTRVARVPTEPFPIVGLGYVKKEWLDTPTALTCEDQSGKPITVRQCGLPSACGYSVE